MFEKTLCRERRGKAGRGKGAEENMIATVMNTIGGTIFALVQLQVQIFFFTLGEKREKNWLSKFVLLDALLIGSVILEGMLVYADILSRSDITSIHYFVNFFANGMILYWCFQLSFPEIVFMLVGASSLQHICFCVVEIARYMSGVVYSGILTSWMARLLLNIVVGFAFYEVVLKKEKTGQEHLQRDWKIIAFATLMGVIANVLDVRKGYAEITKNTKEEYMIYIICNMYSLCCCVMTLLLLFTTSRKNIAIREAQFMEQAIHTMDMQNQMTKQSIELINRKCHDLKYQVKAIKHYGNEEERNEYIEEIRNSLNIYDAIYHTGNETLDCILREKALLCQEYGIQLSCMANGEALSFMKPMDVSVLFENALDNAIEAVCKENDVQKRFISFQIRRQNAIVLAHLENRCTGQTEFVNGLPVTSKDDQNYHGFGTRSMEYIVKKYHGNLVMKQEKDIFSVDVIFGAIEA